MYIKNILYNRDISAENFLTSFTTYPTSKTISTTYNQLKATYMYGGILHRIFP